MFYATAVSILSLDAAGSVTLEDKATGPVFSFLVLASCILN